MQDFNIVELIENNPISKLSSTYNNKLLDKIKNTFNDFEQQLFISSFYCYLKYDKTNDFVVDLDNVWKWLGFNQKHDAKRLLEKHYILDKDYKTAQEISGAVLDTGISIKKNGGQNIKKIFMTIRCFKSFCLKAQTSKAAEIHEYYINLEDILQQTIDEETQELKEQVLQIKTNTEEQKQLAVEEAIVSQFPLNTECIYFGTIKDTNNAGEQLIKFGHTNNLSKRIHDHRKDYIGFVLKNAFRVQNKVEIENLIKNHPKIKKQIRNIQVNSKNRTEIIAYDNNIFTIDDLTKYIKDIIQSKTYSIDNFNKLLKQNDELQSRNNELEEQAKKYSDTITTLTIEIDTLKDTIEKQKTSIELLHNEHETVYSNSLLPENDLTKSFNTFIDTMCIVRSDVEESCVNMEGQYRIWCKTKPKKEVFHAFKNYLDIRFKPSRITSQNKNQVVNGYIGVKLKNIEYKKRLNNDVENFIFQVCKFTPSGKILNNTLLNEYTRWKISLNKECNNNEMKELKNYLNDCEYTLKAVVWTEEGSNEGYYGICLKRDEYKHKKTSSTGKKVEKIEFNTGAIIGTWETIAKAAEFENISPAKMSRSIKTKTIFNDDYYYKTA